MAVEQRDPPPPISRGIWCRERSVAAVAGGKSIDTSIGLTPLEGLVMGTRCGDLDPAVHFYLLRLTGMTPAELERLRADLLFLQING